ncbi:MAG: holo-ACP synthase [Actinomycetota bacterium]|nr:holo-ACP synthase [Actinomycetota bacterium]
MGVDVVTVERVARLATESPDILATIFTDRELALCDHGRRIERLAGRLAAKEALLKAFGTGLLSDIELADIEIDTSPCGRPVARLYRAAAARANSQGMVDVDVSISHTAGLAIAQAIVVYDAAPAPAD